MQLNLSHKKDIVLYCIWPVAQDTLMNCLSTAIPTPTPLSGTGTRYKSSLFLSLSIFLLQLHSIFISLKLILRKKKIKKKNQPRTFLGFAFRLYFVQVITLILSIARVREALQEPSVWTY